MPDSIHALVEGVSRCLPALALVWLAVFFGRSLRRGATPLIEHVARRSDPLLTAALCRCTRGLTALWCACFIAAAVLVVAASESWAQTNLLVWAGTLVLIVGERLARPRIFPGEVFPGLVQQLRDTWSVWRMRG